MTTKRYIDDPKEAAQFVEGLGSGTWLYQGLKFNSSGELKIPPFVVSWVMGLECSTKPLV